MPALYLHQGCHCTLKPEIVKAGQAVYMAKVPVPLPIFADWLEDQGCTCNGTLQHLRDHEANEPGFRCSAITRLAFGHEDFGIF